MCRSVPQIATESTSHITSIGPGAGVGMSSRTSCALGAVSTSAFLFVGNPVVVAVNAFAISASHVQEGGHPADAPLAADPAPRKRAHGHALAGQLRQVAAKILEHRDVAPRRLVMNVLEPLHRQRL